MKIIHKKTISKFVIIDDNEKFVYFLPNGRYRLEDSSLFATSFKSMDEAKQDIQKLGFGDVCEIIETYQVIKK